MNILLVDDEEEFVSALAERLSLRGLEVDWAVSGQEALERSSAKDYDLVVVDVKMPGLGGQEVMRRMAENRPGLSFIVLSGHIDGGNIPCVPGARQCHRLTKPADIDELLALIQRIKGS